MSDYHTTYKGPEGQTTQWEDIQIRLGNMAPKPAKHKPPTYEGEAEVVRDKQWVEEQDEEQLNELEDSFGDDREMEMLRQKRLRELQEASSKPASGLLEFIRSSDFKVKVTDESLNCWVVVLLFKENHEGCAIVADCLAQLAPRHPQTKFVKIISYDCIANYPDANLPTVLLYHNGECCKTFAGLTIWGGKRASPEYVALVLNQEGPICGDPDETTGEPSEQQMRRFVKRVVLQRQQEVDDEDSDFD